MGGDKETKNVNENGRIEEEYLGVGSTRFQFDPGRQRRS